jgi:ADP-ribose pyrophosphatase
MKRSDTLPQPPAIEVKVRSDQRPDQRGFVWLRQVELQNRYADGSESAPYTYYFVERKQLDAVCLALWRRGEAGPEIILRSQLRPPLAFRAEYDVPLRAEGTGAVQWEVPAGLVEAGEHGESGLFARAAAEALEEVGVSLPRERFFMLGHATSLSPGLIAEKLHFVHAEILESDERSGPKGDGHPVEDHAESLFVRLPTALEAVASGLVHDIKTEIAIRRLAELLAAEAV